MKKLYEDPIFEINKFSFEDILNTGAVQDSDPESTNGYDGNDRGEDPFA